MSFYLSIDGANRGPFDLHTLEQEYRAGIIPAATPCWTDGWPAWRPIEEAFPAWTRPPLAASIAERTRPTRRPHPLAESAKLILVLLAGLLSSCVLGAVMALGAQLTGYSMYGWLIWGFFPIGAIAAGLCGAGGAFYAARWLHYYPRFLFSLGSIVLGVLTLVLTQYCIYSRFALDPIRRTDFEGFQQHLTWVSHHVTLKFNYDEHGVELRELSTWYYVSQIVGFCVGGLMVTAMVRSRPFCHECQKYYGIFQHAEFHEYSSDTFSTKFDQARVMLRHANYADAQRRHAIKHSLKDAGYKQGFRSVLITYECAACKDRRYRHEAFVYKRQGGWSQINSLTKNFPVGSKKLG